MEILSDEILRGMAEYLNRDLDLHGVVTKRGRDYRIDFGKMEAACVSATYGIEGGEEHDPPMKSTLTITIDMSKAAEALRIEQPNGEAADVLRRFAERLQSGEPCDFVLAGTERYMLLDGNGDQIGQAKWN